MRLAPLALTKPGRRPSAGRFLLLVALGSCLLAASAFAASLQIAQKHRAFSRTEVTIQRGDTIAFSNDDEFLHQIYVDSKAMSFDSAEQVTGQTINVPFPQPGTFRVRCHIHPKMLLTVHVQ